MSYLGDKKGNAELILLKFNNTFYDDSYPCNKMVNIHSNLVTKIIHKAKKKNNVTIKSI